MKKLSFLAACVFAACAGCCSGSGWLPCLNRGAPCGFPMGQAPMAAAPDCVGCQSGGYAGAAGYADYGSYLEGQPAEYAPPRNELPAPGR
jgi:hypothetical protein